MRLIWNGSCANVTFNLTCASCVFLFVLLSFLSCFQCARKCFCLTFHFLLMFCVCTFFWEMNFFFILLLLNFFFVVLLARSVRIMNNKVCCFSRDYAMSSCFIVFILAKHKRIVNLRHDKNKLVAEMKKISLCFIQCWLIKKRIFVLLSKTFFWCRIKEEYNECTRL